jgi:diacylglycerol O-acyltransferase
LRTFRPVLQDVWRTEKSLLWTRVSPGPLKVGQACAATACGLVSEIANDDAGIRAAATARMAPTTAPMQRPYTRAHGCGNMIVTRVVGSARVRAMRQLTSLDAQFLAIENGRNLGHVSGLSIYDPTTAPGGILDSARMCAVLTERLHLLPPFRWRLAEVPLGLDHPYWIEDPDFDIEYHVRELGLPAPGDDRQLAEQVARLHSRALDRARPLWELYVIQGLKGGHVAVFTKIHHAAVDGMSGTEILSVLLDPTPSGRELPPAPDAQAPPPAPGQLEMLGRGMVGMPLHQLRALRAVPQTLAHLDAIPGVQDIPGAPTVARITRRLGRIGRPARDGGMLESPRAHAPRMVFNGPVSAHRRVAFGTLSLKTVKEIKNAQGTTVNDVIVAICAGGLRAWLQEHGELPDDPLVAMIPVSVRTPEQRGTFGNRVSTMAVAIPTDLDDPLERLAAAHEALRSAKDAHSAIPATLMQDAAQFVPPAIHARASRVTLRLSARNAVSPIFNVVISNVPGSATPLYSAGARLLANYPVSAVADGMGLNITVLSYEDRLDFAIVADREQVSDAWPLMDALGVALNELKAASAK